MPAKRRIQATSYLGSSPEFLATERKRAETMPNRHAAGGVIRAVNAAEKAAAEAAADPRSQWVTIHPDDRKESAKASAVFSLLLKTFGRRWLVLTGYALPGAGPNEIERETQQQTDTRVGRERQEEEAARIEFRTWTRLLALRVARTARARGCSDWEAAGIVTAGLIDGWRDIALRVFATDTLPQGWSQLSEDGVVRQTFQGKLRRAVYDATRPEITSRQPARRTLFIPAGLEEAAQEGLPGVVRSAIGRRAAKKYSEENPHES